MNREKKPETVNVPAARFMAAAVMVAAGVVLPACSEKKEPLPGDRISILTTEQSIHPDQEASAVPVRLPRPQPNKDWPQAGGSPSHDMGHPSADGSLKVLWSKSAGSGSSSQERLLAPPVVADGHVFTIDVDSDIYAFDAESGAKLWDTDITPDEEDDGSLGGGLAYEDGRIFATSGFAQVVALDAKTGKEIWRKAMPGPMRAPPAVKDGRVFAVTIDNQTVALSAADGEKIWTHTGVEESTGILGGASPALAQDVMVLPYSSGEIFAVKESNGRVLWSDNLGSLDKLDAVSSLSDIRGRPLISDGRVYVVSHGGRMMALDLRTGFRVWERAIGGTESPWMAGDYIYVLTNDYSLVCLTREEGYIVWVSPLQRYEDMEDEEDPIIWAGPVLVGNRLLVSGSHGYLASFSPYTGQLLGEVDMKDPVIIAPVVANQTVYVLTDKAELIALR